MLFRGISKTNDKIDITHLQLAIFVGDRFLISRHNSPSYSITHWLSHNELYRFMQNPAELSLQILHYSSGIYLQQLLEFEEDLSNVEDLMQSQANDDMLRELTLYKTRLRKLRRGFDYHQKMSAELDQPSGSFLNQHPELKHQTQDLYERCERLHSLSSMYYEICGDLIEGYLSLTSHQLNLTMRVLTVITAVFVPLSFIAGLYGMNFENMPELKWHYGYFAVWGLMLTILAGMILYFKRKRWL